MAFGPPPACKPKLQQAGVYLPLVIIIISTLQFVIGQYDECGFAAAVGPKEILECGLVLLMWQWRLFPQSLRSNKSIALHQLTPVSPGRAHWICFIVFLLEHLGSILEALYSGHESHCREREHIPYYCISLFVSGLFSFYGLKSTIFISIIWLPTLSTY